MPAGQQSVNLKLGTELDNSAQLFALAPEQLWEPLRAHGEHGDEAVQDFERQANSTQAMKGLGLSASWSPGNRPDLLPMAAALLRPKQRSSQIHTETEPKIKAPSGVGGLRDFITARGPATILQTLGSERRRMLAAHTRVS